MLYTRSELNERYPELVLQAEAYLQLVLEAMPRDATLVFEFHKAPGVLQHFCSSNGGDEDWLIVMRSKPQYMPSWIERTDSMEDPDCYELENAVIYVGAHA